MTIPSYSDLARYREESEKATNALELRDDVDTKIESMLRASKVLPHSQ